METQYMELAINDIELDFDNPRIAKWLEMYDKSSLNGEAIALALGGGSGEDGITSYGSLKESIKINNGIIHPIIVNKTDDNRFVVIEGNTRVQIYRELKNEGASGNWDYIRCIVYNNLSDVDIDAIRLQSHLVGPRDWDPYSKAKYLNFLSNEKKMPIAQLISFCGGKASEIMRYINAYNDMEEYYRPLINDDTQFDTREFSKFVEVQSKKEEIVMNGYSMKDFAKWIIDGRINMAIDIRKLPSVLKSKEAMEVFLKSNISEALKKVIVESSNAKNLNDVSYDELAYALEKKIYDISHKEVESLKYDPSHIEKKNALYGAYESLKWLIDYMEEE